jgi:hypothetical protein
MAWDFSRPWSKSQWAIVREPINKWDLVEKYSEHEEAILRAEDKDDKYVNVSIYKDSLEIVEEDIIYVYRFFHEKTEAVPTGRYCYYVADQWLDDVELPYRKKPISRITPGEWIGQGTGWTPAFSLQAPQEMLNGELSAIASNHAAFGTQDMWVPTGQEKLKVTRHKGGLRVISSGVKPEALSLLDTKPEMFKFVQDLITNMQLIVGVTGATRGIPEKGVTAGNALALLDAQSIQFNSSFVYSFNRFNEDVATSSIRTLQDFANTERVITILGKANMPYRYKFRGEDLKKVDRFVVESVNPLTKTLAGRDAKAKDLIQIGAIRTPEQYNQVFESGNLEPMFEAAMSQLSIIRDENEALLEGNPVHAAEIDHHVLHIKEHATIFGTIANRQDPNIAGNGLPHIMDHISKLMDPNIQLLQMTLGYQVPPGFMLSEGMMTPAPPQEAGESEPQPPEGRGHKPEIKMPKPAKPPKRLGKEENEEEVA